MAATIALLVGSLRTGSYNQKLADVAEKIVRARGHRVWRPNHDAYQMPIYHGDLEQSDFPPPGLALKSGIAVCDAILFVAPEYNGSVSPLLKNVIDWTSRSTDGEPPLALTAYRGKAAGLLSASIGPTGGVRALGHLRQICQALQMIVVPQEVRVGNAAAAFTPEGALADAGAATQLDLLLNSFLSLTERLAR